MTSVPSKDNRKEEKDNIFLEMLYQIVVYVPVLVISWVIDKFSD